jgi:hypothetical protein
MEIVLFDHLTRLGHMYLQSLRFGDFVISIHQIWVVSDKLRLEACFPRGENGIAMSRAISTSHTAYRWIRTTSRTSTADSLKILKYAGNGEEFDIGVRLANRVPIAPARVLSQQDRVDPMLFYHTDVIEILSTRVFVLIWS